MFFARPQLIESVSPAALREEAVPTLPARWRCDLQDDRLTWAPDVFDLFGIDRTTKLDRREIVEMYDDESRDMLERLRSRAIATAGSFTLEAWIVRPSGERRWMQVAADTLAVGGRVTHLSGTKRDITADAR